MSKNSGLGSEGSQGSFEGSRPQVEIGVVGVVSLKGTTPATPTTPRRPQQQSRPQPFREDVQCFVDRLTYDFVDRVGVIELPDRSCTDMAGCIRLFSRIDPDVKIIQTVSGGKPDTQYRRCNREWQSWLPGEMA